MIVNAAKRSFESILRGNGAYYNTSTKRDIYQDYGYPEDLDFDDFYKMYRRNGIAHAAVEKTKLKTWQDYPAIYESQEAKESEEESDIRQHFEDIRLWQAIAEADARSVVGGYAGLILRLADDLDFDQPVNIVGGGIEGLVEVIPVWAGQLEPSVWGTDLNDPETYGKPTMYEFNEAALPDSNDAEDNKTDRVFNVHPDRVIIWSKDGTVSPSSDLEAGFNALLDIEKVIGAGGEGFWKTARAALTLEIDKEARAADMAAFMGVEQDEIADTLDDSVKDFMQGFDASLMMQGMQAKPINVSLPNPEPFFMGPLQVFAASMCMPVKILIGMITGERASTEDAREWAQTCMSRRTNIAIPTIRAIINRLERFNIIPERDWVIDWSDLTESNMAEKIERADKMASINQRAGGAMGSEIVFTADEIREAVGLKPLSEAERFIDVDMPDDTEEDFEE